MERELEEAVRPIRPLCRTEPPVKETGKENKEERPQDFNSEKILARLTGSPQAKGAHQRNPESSRNGPALVLLCSVMPGSSHRKHGLRTNAMMDFRGPQLGPSV